MNLGCIKPLCDLLTVMDSKIVQVALNGLENILRLGEQEANQSGTGINPYCSLIEEAYGRWWPVASALPALTVQGVSERVCWIRCRFAAVLRDLEYPKAANICSDGVLRIRDGV